MLMDIKKAGYPAFVVLNDVQIDRTLSFISISQEVIREG